MFIKYFKINEVNVTLATSRDPWHGHYFSWQRERNIGVPLLDRYYGVWWAWIVYFILEKGMKMKKGMAMRKGNVPEMK